MTCLRCGEVHQIDVNVQVLQARIRRVNIAAHNFLKSQASQVPADVRRAQHVGMLDLSREYFPFLDGLVVEKDMAVRRKLHAKNHRKKEERRKATASLIGPEAVPEALLLEFTACYRKHLYYTSDEAEAAIITGVHGAAESHAPYSCGYCRGWHVGHPTGPTTPHEYRLSRARMIWATQPGLANRFACERGLVEPAEAVTR